MTIMYNPGAFNAQDIETAKQIVLTHRKNNLTSTERWSIETSFIVDDLRKQFGSFHNQLILDYGAGIGRVAKEVIRQFNTRVVGLDFSSNMNILAAMYVDSSKYITITSDMLNLFEEKFDLVLAIWSLQHMLDPQTNINEIQASLKHDGKLYVINEDVRLIPTIEGTVPGWSTDNKDVFKMLEESFKLIEKRSVPEYLLEEESKAWIGVFTKI